LIVDKIKAQNKLPSAIFIMGPTAAGKTDLAVSIAKEYPVEIISVDSALVYRGMNIGTAKPLPKVMRKYPHHLIDILEPTESYSVGNFHQDALALMLDITSRGKVPLLVGGTMLYFKALQYGLAELPSADPVIRARLSAEASDKGLLHLHNRLAEIDPVSAKRIHQNDPQRIQRALEVYELSGRSLTALTQAPETLLPYQITKIVLSPFDRKVLHQRIEDRFRMMMANGLLEEVTNLYDSYENHDELTSLRAVGYRQVLQYLSGAYDLETCIKKAIIATRQMAKRQITWLRAQNDSIWFDSDDDLIQSQVISLLERNIPGFNNNA
jgi:tRNA dimethylallyltransferase